MPAEGQRSVTIKESIYDIIESCAKDEGRSVSNMTEWMAAVYAGRKMEKKRK